MTTTSPTAPAAAPFATRLVDRLVAEQLIHPGQRERAFAVVADELDPRGPGGPAVPPARTGASGRGGMSALVEVVAYLGGALVLAAGALFVVELWDALSFGSQVATVAVLAVALLGGGVGVVAGHAHAVLQRVDGSDSRRRLASTLLTGGALAVAVLVGMLVDRAGGSSAYDASSVDWTLLTASFAGLLVAAAAYALLAGSAVGVIGVATALVTLVGTAVGPVGGDEGLVSAAVFVPLAVAWLVATERGLLREVTLARVLGVLLALYAVQAPVVEGDAGTVAYALTALLAVVGTVVYLRLGAWPYLAIGVVAVTVVVPEAVTDWTGGGLGAVGAVLVTGLTLLLASLVGAWLRSRRET
ncbi:hypothetical protein [Nocardioides marmoraquaticus]